MSVLAGEVYFVRSLTWRLRLATVGDFNNKYSTRLPFDLNPLPIGQPSDLLSSHWSFSPLGLLSGESKVFGTTWQFIPLQSDLLSRIYQIAILCQATGRKSPSLTGNIHSKVYF